MVKKNLKSINILPPAIIIGVTVAISFYLLIIIKDMLTMTILLLFIFINLGILFINKKIQLNKNFVFIISGLIISFFSIANLKIFESPISTLADINKIKQITVQLQSEPKPAGKYYRIPAKIHSCQYSNHDYFSAHGNINIFLPKSLIDQNLAGGIITVGKTNKNDCTIFVKGVILSAIGKFSTNKHGIPSFFINNSVPKCKMWKSDLAKIRGHLRFNLMRLLYTWGDAGALLLALLAADKNFLSNNIQKSFIDAGLAHILALSGMHISIISTYTTQFTKLFMSKKYTVLASFLTLICFIWFAGSSPSLNRALGMTTLLIIGRMIGLQPKVFSILCFMFIIHILFIPQESLTLGFMLSYGALAGIVLFGESITTLLEGTLPKKIISSVSTSIGAQSFTSPIIIIFIGKVAVIGIIASSIISPIIAIYLIIGLLCVFLSFIFPNISFIFHYILHSLSLVIFKLVNIFSMVTPLQVNSLFSTFLYAIIPILLGSICMYKANQIKIERLIFARTYL